MRLCLQPIPMHCEQQIPVALPYDHAAFQGVCQTVMPIKLVTLRQLVHPAHKITHAPRGCPPCMPMAASDRAASETSPIQSEAAAAGTKHPSPIRTQSQAPVSAVRLHERHIIKSAPQGSHTPRQAAVQRRAQNPPTSTALSIPSLIKAQGTCEANKISRQPCACCMGRPRTALQNHTTRICRAGPACARSS